MIIGKRYELRREIKGGGFAMVYLGHDQQTNTPVAVKKLHPNLTTDADNVERFRREGQALRDLNHPNIVKMFDMLEEGGAYYLIMEFIPGGDLRNLLTKALGQRRRLSLQRVLNIGLDVADALTRAHRLGIVHRDLKPDNVLLANDGTPRVNDFGVARFDSARMTRAGAIIGTPAYQPPEALRGEGMDHRGDVWSFGVMLFEMLTGLHPFAREPLVSMFSSILTEEPPDLRRLRANTPDALVELVYRMIAKDPQQRIPSMRIVATELEALIRGEQYGITQTHRFSTTVNPSHNLPQPAFALLGRTEELAALLALLDAPDKRLISVWGPGGVGKTRLALAAAQERAAQYTHGVQYVDCTQQADLPTVLGRALRVAADADGGYRGPLKQHVADQHRLLLLDGIEQALADLPWLRELLQAAPNLRILLTSRQRLRQSDDGHINLKPLPIPTADALPDPQHYSDTSAYAAENPSAALFVARVRRNQPNYSLTAAAWPSFVRLCELVNGLPLGLVLAANWLDTLTLPELVAELEKDLGFLTTDAANLPARQRGLSASIAYTLALLPEAERDLALNLAVLQPGFSATTIVGVLAAELRRLADLIDVFVLQRDDSSGHFSLDPLLRRYALAQGLPDHIHDQHLRYFAQSIEPLADAVRNPSSSKLIPQLHEVQVAWAYALERERFEALLDLLARVVVLADGLGLWEGLEALIAATLRVAEGRVTAALAAGDPAYDLLFFALIAQDVARMQTGAPRSQALNTRRAIALLPRLQNASRSVAFGLVLAVRVLADYSYAAAAQAAAEATRRLENTDLAFLQVRVLKQQALAAWLHGRSEEAAALLQQAEQATHAHQWRYDDSALRRLMAFNAGGGNTLADEAPLTLGAGAVPQTLLRIGQSYLRLGAAPLALATFAELVERAQQTEQYGLIASAHVYIGAVYVQQGRLPTAEILFDEAEGTFRRQGDQGGRVWALLNRGVLRLRQGDAASARRDMLPYLEYHQAQNHPGEVVIGLWHLVLAALPTRDTDTARELLRVALGALADAGAALVGRSRRARVLELLAVAAAWRLRNRDAGQAARWWGCYRHQQALESGVAAELAATTALLFHNIEARIRERLGDAAAADAALLAGATLEPEAALKEVAAALGA